MYTPSAVIVSIWRNDAERQIENRIQHLLSKSYPRLRWLWAVGDSSDDTETILRQAADTKDKDIRVYRFDTLVEGDEPEIRIIRMGRTANAAFDHVRGTDDLLVMHESDLISPTDIVQSFVETGHAVVGGWPTLGDGDTFYDTWAYRAGGLMFSNNPPYSPVYQPDRLFELDSVGSVWMAPAREFGGMNGIRMNRAAVLDIMAQLRGRGYRVWCDPHIHIIQPRELWTPMEHAIPV